MRGGAGMAICQGGFLEQVASEFFEKKKKERKKSSKEMCYKI